MKRLAFLLALIAALALTAVAVAQAGSLGGQVYISGSSPTIYLSGATVRIQNGCTGAVGSTVTNGGGAYSFTGISCSFYSVTVSGGSICTLNTSISGLNPSGANFRNFPVRWKPC